MFRFAKYLLPFAVVWGAGCDQPSPPTTADPKAVQADVTALLHATDEKDLDTLLDLTHPVVIEGLGGRDSARASLEQSLSGLSISRETLTFPEAPQFLEGQVNQFVVVPTLSTFSSPAGRVESLNFQFGARKRGTTLWKYIEGSRLNRENIHQFFADFPKDFAFPETNRRKL